MSQTLNTMYTIIGLPDNTHMVSAPEKKQELNAKFMAIAKSTTRKRVLFSALIKHYPKWLKLSHFVVVCPTTKVELVVTYVVGKCDADMVELARICGLPRGLAIIHDTVDFVAMACFLPKFENDARCQKVQRVPLGATQCRFAKKFSGSLGLLAAFKYKQHSFVFYGAKNSTGNVYSAELATLLHQWYSDTRDYERLLAYLRDQSATVCFETCSSAEYMGEHGASYKRGLPVALVIAETGNNDVIASYQDDDTSLQVFRTHALPHEARYHTDEPQMLLELFNRERDLVTNATFDTLVDNTPSVRVEHGNISHAQLSDVLEGIIMWFSDASGTTLCVQKLKFAKYTRMTMCVRPLLQRAVVAPGTRLKRYRVVQDIQEYTSRWVVSADARRLHEAWLYRAMEIISTMSADTAQPGYLCLAEPAIAQAEAEIASAPAKSILPAVSPLHISLVIGHVGAGKTVLCDTLTRMDDRIFSISVDDYTETTSAGGGIKNNHVLGHTVYAGCCGYYPVIENGGGLFWNSRRKRLGIVRALRTISPAPVHIDAIFCPTAIADAARVDMRALLAQTCQAVDSRVARGIYTAAEAPKLRAKLPNVSRTNYEKCQKPLLEYAHKHGIAIVPFELNGRDARFDACGMPNTSANQVHANSLGSECAFTYGYMVQVGDVVGHITCGYGVSYVNTRTFVEADTLKPGATLLGTTLYFGNYQQLAETPAGRRPKKYWCVYVDNHVDNMALPEHAHVSGNAPFKMRLMSLVVRAHVAGEPSCTVDACDYLVWASDVPAQVRVLRKYCYAI